MSAPAIFVSHGSPMFAVEPGQLGPQLQSLGRTLRKNLSAILIVSAHWQSAQVRVMATGAPETIHDFGGFPEELYEIRYPALGSSQLAEVAARLLRDAGFDCALDDERGLDHGAWVPLRYLEPHGKIPVFEVSLGRAFSTQEAINMGMALAPLRGRGVAILGSGGLTHNLQEYFGGSADTAYAIAFAQWMQAALARRDSAQLADYRRLAPNARRAHPTEEHFMPLLVAYGASSAADLMSILDGGMDGVLSMDSFVWNA